MKRHYYVFLSALIAATLLFFPSGADSAVGGFLFKWGNYGTGSEGQFSYPHGIALDGDGNVYVTEINPSRVQVFDSNGVYLSQWGSYGTGDGQFKNPYGMYRKK